MSRQSALNLIVRQLREAGAVRIGLFGSARQGILRRGSDLDILVRFRRPLSLLRFTSLQRRLSRQVGRPVDLVTEDSLSPYLRRPIHRQQILLHGER